MLIQLRFCEMYIQPVEALRENWRNILGKKWRNKKASTENILLRRA